MPKNTLTNSKCNPVKRLALALLLTCSLSIGVASQETKYVQQNRWEAAETRVNAESLRSADTTLVYLYPFDAWAADVIRSPVYQTPFYGLGHSVGKVSNSYYQERIDERRLWRVINTYETNPYDYKALFVFKNYATGQYLTEDLSFTYDERKAMRTSFYSAAEVCGMNTSVCNAQGDVIRYDSAKAQSNRRVLPVSFEDTEDSVYLWAPMSAVFVDRVAPADTLQPGMAFTLFNRHLNKYICRYGTDPASTFVAGSDYGNVDSAALADFCKVFERAYMLSQREDYDDSAYWNSQRQLDVANARLRESIRRPEEGYYYIVAATKGYAPNAMCYNGILTWDTLNRRCADFVFHLRPLGGNEYDITTLRDGMHLRGFRYTEGYKHSPYYWQTLEHAHYIETTSVGPTFDEAQIIDLIRSGFLGIRRKQPFYVEDYTTEFPYAAYMFTSSLAGRFINFYYASTSKTSSDSAWGFEKINDSALIDSLVAADSLRRLNDTVQLWIARSEEVLSRQWQTEPAVVSAAGVLASAIATAKALQPPTTESLHTLQTAYRALMAVWADTTRLEQLLAEAHTLVATTEVGTALGQFPATALAQLSAATNRVEALRPFARLNKSMVDTTAARLEGDLGAFYRAMNGMQSNLWYFILSDLTPATTQQQRIQHRCLKASDREKPATAIWGGTTNDNDQEALAAWRFELLDSSAGSYAVRALASGLFLGRATEEGVPLSDTAAAYRLQPMGGGSIALKCIETGLMLAPEEQKKSLIATRDTLNRLTAWTLAAVDAEHMTDLRRFRPHSAHVVTTPYNTQAMPSSWAAPLSFYRLVGRLVDADGRTTHLKLHKLHDEALQAGRPVVMTVGESDESDDYATVDMQPNLATPGYGAKVMVQNGLTGSLQSGSFMQSGYAALSFGDTARATNRSTYTYYDAQTGYIRLNLVQETGEAYDLLLPVERAAFAPMDHNEDSAVNLPDAVHLIDLVKTAASPSAAEYDHNADNVVDLPDAVQIILHVTSK